MIFYLSLWFPPALRARYARVLFHRHPDDECDRRPVSGVLLELDGIARSPRLAMAVLGRGVAGAGAWRSRSSSIFPTGREDAKWLSDSERATIAAELARERGGGHEHVHGLWTALADLACPSSVRGLLLRRRRALRHHLLAAADRPVAWDFRTSETSLLVVAALRAGRRFDDRVGAPQRCHRRARLACCARLPLGRTRLRARRRKCRRRTPSCSWRWRWSPSASARRLRRSGPSRPRSSPARLQPAASRLINAVGNLGGFVGPYAVGWALEVTGSYAGGMAILAVSMAIAAVLVLAHGSFPATRRSQLT